MRIMGIDYGDARVGISMCDPLEITAQGLVTLPNKVYSKMLDALCKIITEYDVKKIVLGMPKNMNGDIGDRVEITMAFSKELNERFPDIDAFADTTAEEIEPYIHSCGFYRAKAKDINEMCKMLREKYNYIIPDTVEELTKLPGVGRKTANLVVGDIYKKPAVVTDTHCIRICGLLGLTENTVP